MEKYKKIKKKKRNFFQKSIFICMYTCRENKKLY